MFAVIVAQAVSALIVVIVYCRENSIFWQTRQLTRSWFKDELSEILSPSSLIYFLVSVSLIFSVTYFAYAKYLGLDEAVNYALFGGPCVAGMVAGFGLLLGRPKRARIEKDWNVIFYIFSVVILICCYFAYLHSHPSIDVNRIAKETLAGSLIVAVVIKRFTDVWTNSKNDWLLILSLLINLAVFASILL